MRLLTDPAIARYRDRGADLLHDTKPHEKATGGAFLIPRMGEFIRVIASAGADQQPPYRFDHVSVSLAKRCPTWEEMDWIKRLFFHPHEVAYQLHVAEDDHISVHPYCLHLWRHVDYMIPLPPKDTIG